MAKSEAKIKPTIYTTPTCGFCKMAKAFFIKNNIEYTERDVSSDVTAREEMIQKSGQFGVPVTDFGSEIVIGFDKNRFSELTGTS